MIVPFFLAVLGDQLLAQCPVGLEQCSGETYGVCLEPGFRWNRGRPGDRSLRRPGLGPPFRPLLGRFLLGNLVGVRLRPKIDWWIEPIQWQRGTFANSRADQFRLVGVQNQEAQDDESASGGLPHRVARVGEQGDQIVMPWQSPFADDVGGHEPLFAGIQLQGGATPRCSDRSLRRIDAASVVVAGCFADDNCRELDRVPAARSPAGLTRLPGERRESA